MELMNYVIAVVCTSGFLILVFPLPAFFLLSIMVTTEHIECACALGTCRIRYAQINHIQLQQLEKKKRIKSFNLLQLAH